MSLISELRRRNVIRVAMLYGVAAWVLLQVGDVLFGALGLPPSALRLLLGFLVLGFPLALIFSWVYELTPEGLRREHAVERNTSITTQTGRKINVLIAVLLAIAVALLAADRFRDRAAPRDPAATVNDPAPAGRASAGAAAVAVASIAVLPFVNMSDDKSNDYFSDGLSEELLNVLANMQGLRVIARTSSFAFKGKEVTINDVAKALNVDHVLEGSVRKSGDRVRITAQLIRAADSSHLWSKTYDRTLNDVFAVQDEISGQVADALKVQLLGSSSPAAEIGGTSNPKAYEAFLHGLYLRNQGEREKTLRAALSAYDQAIAADPDYARAHAARAVVLNKIGSNGYQDFTETFAAGRTSARRAAELAPDLAEAYLPLAFVTFTVDSNVPETRRLLEKARELAPGNAGVQTAFATMAVGIGLVDEAVAAARRAVELDPVSAEAHVNLAGTYYAAHRWADAEASARRAISLEADRPSAHGALAAALIEQGRLDEAAAEFEREPIAWQRAVGRALVAAKQGRKDEARKQYGEAQAKFGEAASYQYAQISAQLGQPDEAFKWLATARRVRDPGVANLLTDPMVDPLRKDPRFEKLLRELGLETLAAR